MTVARLVGENLLVALVGIGVLSAVGVCRTLNELRRRWGIAYLAGIAAVGILAATLALVHISFPPLALVGLAAAAVAFAAWRMRRRSASEPPVATTSRSSRLDRGVAFVFGAGLLVYGVATGFVVATRPLIEFDGWAIWGLKAHAIAVLGSDSGDVITSPAYTLSHLEYPLLLPALEALGIRAAGAWESRLVVIQCFLIVAGAVLALWGLMRERVRALVLWPVLAALVGTPAVLLQTVSGYADMPLAFFVAAGLVASARWLLDRETCWLALGSLFFAAAALTKDEGSLFVAAAYVGLLLVTAGRRRHVLLSAAAVVCLLVPWRVFDKVNGFSTSDAFQLSKSFDASWVSQQIDRGPTALRALVEIVLNRQVYALLVPLVIAAIALAFTRGARSLALYSATYAVLSFAGLVWIFVLSPIPLQLYLAQTKHRIMASLIVGCTALAPLLVAEASRAGDFRRRHD